MREVIHSYMKVPSLDYGDYVSYCVVGGDVSMVVCELPGQHLTVARAQPVHAPIDNILYPRMPGSVRPKVFPSKEVCNFS